MSDNNAIAQRLLNNINSTVTPKVKRNAELASEFIEKLRETFHDDRKKGFTVSVIHAGSSYEGLAVTNNADFDITLVLWEEFVSDNFVVKLDERSGYFILKEKDSFKGDEFDCMGYLDAGKLKRQLFDSLGNCLNRLQMPNVKVTSKEGLAALTVEVEEIVGERRKISLDLVPQIPFRTWGQCPNLKPLEEMPRPLRQYIDTQQKNGTPIMFFSLAAPGTHRYENTDQLCNVSFSLLEKKFVNSKVGLRDMVRLVKYIAERRDWKEKHAFRSFYAKRVAVKYYEQLERENLWDGTKILLFYLSEEVANGIIDGYFVKDQPFRRWSQKEISDFRDEIEIVRNMDLNLL